MRDFLHANTGEQAFANFQQQADAKELYKRVSMGKQAFVNFGRQNKLHNVYTTRFVDYFY